MEGDQGGFGFEDWGEYCSLGPVCKLLSEKTLVSQGQKCTDPLDYAVLP